jgi:hypothetical protein
MKLGVSCRYALPGLVNGVLTRWLLVGNHFSELEPIYAILEWSRKGWAQLRSWWLYSVRGLSATFCATMHQIGFIGIFEKHVLDSSPLSTGSLAKDEFFGGAFAL